MNEFKITEQKENALFDRKEIRGVIESEVVPSRIEILEILSKKFKIPKENIKIKKITGKFGSKTFSVEANIYSSEQDKDKIELKKKKEKEPEEKEEPAEKKKKPEEKVPEEPTSSPTTSEIKEEAQLESENQSEPQGEAKEQ